MEINRKLIITLILALFLYMIYLRLTNFYGNEKAINYCMKNLNNYDKHFSEIINTINKFNSDSDYFFNYYYKSDTIIFCYFSSEIPFEIDKRHYNQFYKLIRSIPFKTVSVDIENYISFYTAKRNLTGSARIRLRYNLNHSTPVSIQYKGFEILTSNQRPSKYDKWIYIIDKSWYIIVE